mmetsp:Transcript_24227/g.55127  ORF Transcript_24227/g.55127 Transcript_24227/m.55127 type:complete len:299 (+) Transcript_24227:1237-2133(+)
MFGPCPQHPCNAPLMVRQRGLRRRQRHALVRLGSGRQQRQDGVALHSSVAQPGPFPFSLGCLGMAPVRRPGSGMTGPMDGVPCGHRGEVVCGPPRSSIGTAGSRCRRCRHRGTERAAQAVKGGRTLWSVGGREKVVEGMEELGPVDRGTGRGTQAGRTSGDGDFPDVDVEAHDLGGLEVGSFLADHTGGAGFVFQGIKFIHPIGSGRCGGGVGSRSLGPRRRCGRCFSHLCCRRSFNRCGSGQRNHFLFHSGGCGIVGLRGNMQLMRGWRTRCPCVCACHGIHVCFCVCSCSCRSSCG